MINDEDAQVAASVATQLEAIAAAIDAIVERMQRGGRLLYFGAGTSGRLGVLDASEAPPTYNVPAELVIGRIAGGDRALRASIEGAEDDPMAGAAEVAELQVNANDSIVGIAASGSTPYVLGAMQAARKRFALVISLACNHPSPMAEIAQIIIAPLVGPEVIAGSTRMKAGTAQKMVLNMLSTGVMVCLGKTYSNLMVDVQTSNDKLRRRAVHILQETSGLDTQSAADLLQRCDGELKTAIVSVLTDVPPFQARERLESAGGIVRIAL